MSAINLKQTYLVLEPDNAAKRVTVDENFWPDLMSEDPKSEGAKLVAGTRGRLTAMFEQKADWPRWEMHPNGDEVLVMMSGRMVLTLEEDGGNREVELAAGQCCVVPAGVWHTAKVPEPGVLLGITPGYQTQHRPL